MDDKLRELKKKRLEYETNVVVSWILPIIVGVILFVLFNSRRTYSIYFYVIGIFVVFIPVFRGLYIQAEINKLQQEVIEEQLK